VLAGATALVVTSQVGTPTSPPVQAQVLPATVAYDSGRIGFGTDDILGGDTNAALGDRVGTSQDRDGDVLDTSTSRTGDEASLLYPIDSSFTTDELDFFGATPRLRDGVYEEGFAGDILPSIDYPEGGLEVSDVATDLFKAGAPLGTWAAGLGSESIKASTEHYTVMEAILTCYQTYEYDFWTSPEDYAANPDASVPQRTSDELEALGLSCDQLADPRALNDLDGSPIELADLNPNEDSVIMDMAVDPDNSYSVTKKDDGKLLFRWGSSVKKPTDIRFQKSIPLPAEWKDAALDGQKGYRVTRAELVVNHNITNNPNDQIRPEDWENEGATGRLPDYEETADGFWVSTTSCYEGNGNYIPAGTILKYPAGVAPDVDASDLAQGFTPAWFTTIQRNPFEWSYRNTVTGDLVGRAAPDADPDLTLVSGPRWRLIANKFGQDLPGLEIPSAECTPPPYQQGEEKYETGEPTQTVINLLDWNQAEPRWTDATSPLAYSGGWIADWSSQTIPGQVVGPDDAARCVATNSEGCVTALGTTLTDDFDVSFYIKGDVKPAQIYDVQLVLEYEAVPLPPEDFDAADLAITKTASPDPVTAGQDVTWTIGYQNLGPSAATDVTVIDTPPAGVTLVSSSVPCAGTPLTCDIGDVASGASGSFTLVTTVDAATPDGTVLTNTATIASTNVDGDPVPTNNTAVETVTVDVTVEPPVEPPVTDDPFVIITPDRVIDTRTTSPVVGGTTLEVPVVSQTVVPDDAKVAVANVTATQAAGRGFITAYECGTTLPTVSNFNYQPILRRAGLIYAPLSDDGSICLYSSQTVELIVDIDGYTPALGTYDSTTPVRIADTRSSSMVEAGETFEVTPPASDADALAITVTSTNSTSNGYLTAYTCSEGLPASSTVNYRTGLPFANLTIVGNEKICVYTSSTTNIVVDVHGEFSAPVDFDKARLLDTRTGTQPAAGSTTTFDPSTAPDLTGAEVAAVNVTSARSTTNGYFTVWNCADPRPTSSVLNYRAGEAIANLAMVDTTKSVCVYTSAPSDIVLDLVAVTTPTP
jgi:uncharacterized repeat protein (TIGR01451 family)